MQNKQFKKSTEIFQSSTFQTPREYLLHRKTLDTITSRDILEDLYNYFSTQTGRNKTYKVFSLHELIQNLEVSKSSIFRAIEKIEQTGLFLVKSKIIGKNKIYCFFLNNDENKILFEKVSKNELSFKVLDKYFCDFVENNIIKFELENSNLKKSKFKNETEISNLNQNNFKFETVQNPESIVNTNTLGVIHNDQEYYIKNNLKESINQEEKTLLIDSEKVVKNFCDDDLKNKKNEKDFYNMNDYIFDMFLKNKTSAPTETKFDNQNNSLSEKNNMFESEQKTHSKFNIPIDSNKSNLSNEKSNNDKICVAENSTQKTAVLTLAPAQINKEYLLEIGVNQNRLKSFDEIIKLPFSLLENEYLKVLNLVETGANINNIPAYYCKLLEKIYENDLQINHAQKLLRGCADEKYQEIFNIHQSFRIIDNPYRAYFVDLKTGIGQNLTELDLAADLFNKAERIKINHENKAKMIEILKAFLCQISDKNYFKNWLMTMLGQRLNFNEDNYNIIEKVLG